MTDFSAPNTSRQATEDIPRGLLFALPVVPVGIALWVAIWSFGFVASVVALAISVAGVWLYGRGSHGIISRRGAAAIIGLVVVTMLAALTLGLAVDWLRALVDETDLPWNAVLGHPAFWPSFWENFGELISVNGLNLVLAVLFSAAGCFQTLRRLAVAARQAESQQAEPTAAPIPANLGTAPAPPGGDTPADTHDSTTETDAASAQGADDQPRV